MLGFKLLYITMVLFAVVTKATQFYQNPCDMSRFWCSNNECIYSEYVCNDFNNCGDDSDERSCYGCSPGTFSCSKNQEEPAVCIDPALVCDAVCHCPGCEDEDGYCYKEKHTFSFSPLITSLCVIGIVLIIAAFYFVRKHELKTRQARAEGASASDTAQTNEESSIADYHGIEGDLPPAYDAVVDNPVFVLDSPLSGETDDTLPTYEEVAQEKVQKPQMTNNTTDDKIEPSEDYPDGARGFSYANEGIDAMDQCESDSN